MIRKLVALLATGALAVGGVAVAESAHAAAPNPSSASAPSKPLPELDYAGKARPDQHPALSGVRHTLARLLHVRR